MKSKPVENSAIEILNGMNKVFIDGDSLLRSQSIVPIYYLLFRDASKSNDIINRQSLLNFRDDIQKNKIQAETDIAKTNYDLIEFDRLSLQGTNDAGSIRERLRILKEHCNIK